MIDIRLQLHVTVTTSFHTRQMQNTQLYRAVQFVLWPAQYPITPCKWWFKKFFYVLWMLQEQVRTYRFIHKPRWLQYSIWGNQTLWTQDISDPRHIGTMAMVPKCPGISVQAPICPTDSLTLVLKCHQSNGNHGNMLKDNQHISKANCSASVALSSWKSTESIVPAS